MPELNQFERWQQVRQQSLSLLETLSSEDCAAQSMPDASPVKWHLAHTTWFFETFILEKFEAEFIAFHPAFRILFNSYYNGIGEKHPRAQRGFLTRPSLEQVLAYRQNVDARITCIFAQIWPATASAELAKLLELGMQHEQQHQELMLTDIKHLFSCNPLSPAMLPPASWQKSEVTSALRWLRYEAGLIEVGYEGSGFCFDNELPRHRQYVEAFELADRLVSNAEYLDFIKAGGYQDPAFWLAEAWDWIKSSGVQHPLYWHRQDSELWQEFSLHGLLPLDAHAPVCHLSYFEASAYAQWRGARLPSEAEWECAAAKPNDLQQMFEHCWQWTSSSYSAYPGFAIPVGAIGEYNGKFMLNQYVLRGSSRFTPARHARLTYRNFFPASARWQMTGIRLARSLNIE